MSDKTLAWINLTFVACNIYGTRVMAWSVRRASERQMRIVKLPTPPAAGGGPPDLEAAARRSAATATGKVVNGQAGIINLDDLTPAWMAAPPENEIIP